VTDLTVAGCRLSVDERGSGPPVVLVHGLGGTAHDIWKHQLPELEERFHVVAYDLRGSGSSEVTPGPYTIEGMVDDLRALVEHLELGPVALLGHSMGGAIVLSYASRFPGDVRAVVGVGAPVAFPGETREALAARAVTVEEKGMGAVAETVATNGVSPTFREQYPAEFQGLIAMLEQNDPKGYAAQCRALVDLDLAEGLQHITAPLLLVSGDRDGVSPPEATERTAGHVDGSRFTIVEDCGHHPVWEKPAELSAVAWPFLHAHS
jgi:3-oxoadipate enol-lactonase